MDVLIEWDHDGPSMMDCRARVSITTIASDWARETGSLPSAPVKWTPRREQASTCGEHANARLTTAAALESTLRPLSPVSGRRVARSER